MAPSGRRRSPFLSIFDLSCLIFFLFSPSALAQSAVLGIDIGTEYIKAALVKPGIPLDIVLTKDSKRKEAAAIGFKLSTHGAQDPDQLAERLYGGDALAVHPRFPGDVYPNLKPLLGSVLDSKDSEEQYRGKYPGLGLIRDGEGVLGFKSKALGADATAVTVEELLSMQITNIKHNAGTMAGKAAKIQNSVITVPPFYTVDEKRAVALAAELAGLNVMSLMSDGLSVGLHYATSRNFPNIDKGDKPEVHMVYDMGAGSTSATVLKVQSRSVNDVGKFNKTIQEVNVLGVGWDRFLGGDALNKLILDDMLKKFVESNGAKSQNIGVASVSKHGRAMAKLWREAERIRQVLSANTATSANMESLYEDIDFKYKLSRSEFEDMAASYMSKVNAPIDAALSSAKLTVDDLHSVVLHGGAIRTPFVQKQLEGRVGDAAKLRSNVNADEAAVFGAAFKAAGLSPSFRVREISSNDIAYYRATLKWSPKDKERQQTVFLPTSSVGTTKHVPFNTSTDFDLSIFQHIPQTDQDDTLERPISIVKITNLTASHSELVQKHGCDASSIKTTLALRLDPIMALPEVAGGSTSCEADPSAKKAGVLDGVKGMFGLGGDKDQKPLSEGEELSSSTSGSSSETIPEPSADASKSKETPANSNKIGGDDKQTPPKKKVISIALAFETQRLDQRRPSTADLTSMKDRLAAFDKSDKSRRLREETFNSLEAYTYKARDTLTDEGFMSASSEEQRQQISEALSSASEWLHEGGTTAGIEAIKEKLQRLKDLVNPVQKRKSEASRRQGAIDNFQSTLNQTESIVKMVKDAMERSAREKEESASASPASEEATPSASPADPGDLDADPYSSSASATAEEEDPVKRFDAVNPFTEADLSTLTSMYEKAKKWLDENVAQQEQKQPHEDPVFTTSEVNAKAKELNDKMTEVIMKQAKNFMPEGGPGAKKGGQGKKSKSAKKTASSASSSASSASSASSSQSSASPESKTEGHGEL